MDKETVVNHWDKDQKMYNAALSSLKLGPIQGPSGMYHVKNGVIHYGYDCVPIANFAESAHAWNIFH
jgi:hypothetical protein